MSKTPITKSAKWTIFIYRGLIEFFTRKLNKIENRFVQPTNFLTPLSPKIINDGSIDNYLISLNEAFGKQNVNNIAIAGSYGSGKSSIIKTFISENKGVLKVLEISLASFKKPSKFKNKENNFRKSVKYEEDFNEYQKSLELSILQQIIYRVSPKKLPDSRFKRIISFKRRELLVYTIITLLWVYSTFILFQYGYVNKLNPFEWNPNFNLDIWAILLSFIFFSGLGIFIYKKGIRFVNNSKITRISVKGEIDIGKNIDESILNKHLDEVLYFFEKNKFDLVVIEDLDRFNDTRIFSKLREINYLINKSSQIRRRVLFLYAVRDDIFEGEDRTKFFDLTIPVIPVVDYSNSKSKLKRKLDSLPNYKTSSNQKTKEKEELFNQQDDNNLNKLLYKPTEEFINQISFFINDMRMINNICNEYFIYRESLLEIPDQDKLLALIIYKNLKPEDFDALQKNKGILYNLIQKKLPFRNSKIEKLREEVSVLTKDIDKLENMIETNIDELRGIYISTIIKNAPSRSSSIALKGIQVEYSELFDDTNFEDLSKGSNMRFYGIQSNGYEQQLQEKFSFKEIEEKIESNLKYHEREQLIVEKLDNQITEKKLQISLKKKEISLISNKSIFEILKVNSITDYVQNETSLLEETLLIFFLRHGYIDEHYSHYISRFYDTEVTVEEQKFILNVLNEVDNDFEQSIQNGKYVVERIQGFFGKQSALNINLLEFLLLDSERYLIELNEIVRLICKEEQYSIEFLESFIEISDKSDKLFSLLTPRWLNIWKFVERNKYDNILEGKLFTLIISNSKVEDLEKISLNSNLKDFLNNESVSLEHLASMENFGFVKELIERLNLNFREIGILNNSENKSLVDFIVMGEFYQINKGNIEFIFKRYSKTTISKTAFNNQNLTCILESHLDFLILYIKKYIYLYIDNVFLEIKGNNQESEETLIYLMDEDELTEVQKEQIIIQSNIIIEDVSKIHDVEAKEILFQNQHLKINWENILDFFEAMGTKTELSETLENFLNNESVSGALKALPLYKTSPEQETEAETFLGLSIIYNSKISLKNYINLLQSFHKNWLNLEASKIDPKKVIALIDNEIIALNKKNFNDLEEINGSSHLYLIEKNWDDFSKNFKDYELSEADVHSLLQSKNIILTKKKDLIDYLEEDFIADDEDLSSEVISILSMLQVKDINYTFLRDLYKHPNNLESKIKILNLNLKSYSRAQLRVLVNKLGGVYSDMVKSFHKPKIPATAENIKLVENLKNKKVVSTFEIIEKTQEIKVRAKKWDTLVS